MGIATPTLPPVTSHSKVYNSVQLLPISMSQDYHHQAGIFSFSNGFERSQQEQQQQHIAQQIRREKLRVQGFDPPPPPPPPPLVGIEEEDQSSGLPVYETAGMLSEMFNFPSGGGTATELLENQILQSYRNSRPTAAAEWYSQRGGGQMDLGESKNDESGSQHPHNQINSINANSAAAMQLFLMNPQQQRSPSPSPPVSTSSTLHMLLPNPALHNAHFTWLPNSANESNPSEIPGVVEGQGLALSLSSSLQQMEAAKAEEMRMGEGNMLFFGHGSQYQMKNHQQQQQMHVGLGSSSFGTVNMLRNSKYAKAAQELLEEFCSVGRGQFKKDKFRKHNNNSNPTTTAAAGNSSSSTKDQIPPLSAADRLEHQRRKVKLLSMLDEVDRRYTHYCEQMQMVVNSFDMVMGFGAAVPYTSLAQKAMSRHFRCLKDAIAAQLKHSCELLGEKDAGSSGVTKGETPRLRLLDQSLRQQRAFHQMGMMEQEAWRPQRGLPERSVNILRAWLFEHFLHPYPSDADKHLLARQTGLSRNQVSNWFINARVRLWKPMVEEMYQQESKEEDGDPNQQGQDQDRDQSSGSASAQTPTPTPVPTTTTTTTSSATAGPDSDPSFTPINRHCFLDTTLPPPQQPSDTPDMGSTLIRFGPTSGDVSLTLGLRHAGNMPEKNQFSVRDFGGC